MFGLRSHLQGSSKLASPFLRRALTPPSLARCVSGLSHLADAGYGGTMNAVFTFKLSDLIAGLTRSNQWEWHGPCEAELMDRWNADLKSYAPTPAASPSCPQSLVTMCPEGP